MPKDTNVMPVFPAGEIHPAPIHLFSYERDLRQELAAGLDPQAVIAMHDCMWAIRLFEVAEFGERHPVPYGEPPGVSLGFTVLGSR